MHKHAARKPHCLIRLLAVFALLPSAALACLWDHDTLRQERSKFPEVLELITGKFLRHSPEFYEWRINDRLEKLKADPNNLAYHDDLAVAYSKVGRTKDAITTMEAKEKLKPGLYETNSNLGTFYILAGEFEKGLPYIDKALAINPDAHFGREKYQKWFVEYALTRKDKDGKLAFPLRRFAGVPDDARGTYYDFLQHRMNPKAEPLTSEQLAAAIRGVSGMIRFAKHDNPLLLEAMGDLLSRGYGSYSEDAKMLAARCYLRASTVMKTSDAREEYRKLAASTIFSQLKSAPAVPNSHEKLELEELEREFSKEQADADRWYADLRTREIGWIREGKNADAEFDRLYTEEPHLPLTGPAVHPDRPREIRISWPRTLGLAFGVVGLVGTILVAARRRSAQRTSTPSGV